MTDPIRFPWPCLCSVNERLGPAGPKLRLTRKYRRCLKAASLAAMAGWRGDTLEGPVEVRVTFYWPDRRNRDLDDWAKVPLDSLQEVAYGDDGQIVRLELIDGGVDTEDPRAEVLVERATEEAA